MADFCGGINASLSQQSENQENYLYNQILANKQNKNRKILNPVLVNPKIMKILRESENLQSQQQQQQLQQQDIPNETVDTYDRNFDLQQDLNMTVSVFFILCLKWTIGLSHICS